MSEQTALLAWEIEDRSHVLRARKTDEGWAASFVSNGEQKLVANPSPKRPARFVWEIEQRNRVFSAEKTGELVPRLFRATARKKSRAIPHQERLLALRGRLKDEVLPSEHARSRVGVAKFASDDE
jgi:hypothetical protein